MFVLIGIGIGNKMWLNSMKQLVTMDIPAGISDHLSSHQASPIAKP
jgi:hypothetical protein